VDHEDGDVGGEPAGPFLARLRNLRQQERPHDEEHGERNERVCEPSSRPAEGAGEAEEQVGEEDEQREPDATGRALGQVAGMIRDQAEQLEEPE